MPTHISLAEDIPLTARLACTSIGTIGAFEYAGNGVTHTRTESHSALCDPETLQVALPRHGLVTLEQDDRQVSFSARDLVLYDSSRPHRLAMKDEVNLQVWAIPKSILRLSQMQSRQITAIPLIGRTEFATLVHQFLTAAMKSSAQLENDPQADAVGQHIADLIGTLIQSSFGPPVDIDDVSAVLRNQIMSFVRSRHADNGLNPSMIAHAHHISVRKLHALFADRELSLMDSVRVMRLKFAQDDLSSAHCAHKTLGHIAFRHGFSTLSGFSRAFRTEFGMTPTCFRNAER